MRAGACRACREQLKYGPRPARPRADSIAVVYPPCTRGVGGSNPPQSTTHPADTSRDPPASCRAASLVPPPCRVGLPHGHRTPERRAGPPRSSPPPASCRAASLAPPAGSTELTQAAIAGLVPATSAAPAAMRRLRALCPIIPFRPHMDRAARSQGGGEHGAATITLACRLAAQSLPAGCRDGWRRHDHARLGREVRSATPFPCRLLYRRPDPRAPTMDLNTDRWARAHGKSSRRVAGLDPSDCRVGARASVLVCHHGDEKAPLGIRPISGPLAGRAPSAHAPTPALHEARHAGPHFRRSAGVG